MEKYLYTVNPRIPIRNVIPGQLITRETNISLTLDEVKICLKHGPVYRKFANANQSIQVTLENCERLHRRDYEQHIEADSEFIPKEDKPKVEAPKENNEEKKEFEPPVLEQTETPEEVVSVDVKTEDNVEETPSQEEVVAVDVKTADEEPTTTEDVVAVDVKVSEDNAPETINSENNQQNRNKYNNKKYKK